ncbi:hypothetical protein CU669_05600 [Paramagnetospirillum kuznetsovii]|uniref:DUF1269 domain-containing protein n=1 Tax=Paramagnetospirillum kuznetsovii TaxID=2053833 RepID=A0A364P1L3_9PROT|nr:hypothetical protein [Paramagnetospirillum kuznetsovii]RAU23057.1 hypothetical protein CU669_05600 [Paramagnetospirillum kuznetsovii]
MTAQTKPAALREVVGTFADRAHFEAAVSALLECGFDRGRLSVLASHDSLEVAGGKAQKWRDGLVALVGEMKYEGPLVAAGLIALAAGPVGAVIAGLIAAGVGGVAVKELLDEVAAIPDSGDFTRALAAGSVILWVSVENAAEEARVKPLLAGAGGANIHIFERAKGHRH